MGLTETDIPLRNKFIEELDEKVCTESFLSAIAVRQDDLFLDSSIVLNKIRSVMKIGNGIPDAWVRNMFGFPAYV